MTYTFKIARRLAGNHRHLLSTILLVGAAGCGAGTGGVLAEGPGSIVLTVGGLAAGVEPQITITGPTGFSLTVTQPGPVSGLALGTYQVRSLPTTAQGNVWRPVEATQTFVLTDGDVVASVAMQYQLVTGALDIRTDGLPSSTGAAVRVTGPGGLAQDVNGNTTIRGLEPGSYTVSATPRSVGTARYYPSHTSTNINVVASLVHSTAVVDFRRLTGALNVEITGLPVGAVGQFSLTGPGNYHASLTGAVQLQALDPGDYMVTALPVQWQEHTWSPLPATIPVTIDTATTTIEIANQISTGTLELGVVGLPAGVDAQITLSGPAGFSASATGDRQWIGIDAGLYTATAAVVILGTKRFVPIQNSLNISVAPGTNATTAQVTYSESTGSLLVAMSGLPAGMLGRVIVSGEGIVDTVGTTTTLTGLVPGDYTVVAETIGVGEGAMTGAPASQVAVIVAGATASKTVAYGPIPTATANLTVGITGLPLGTTAPVTVAWAAGGYSQAVPASTTLTSLVTPGTYVVTAASVTVGGVTYTPTPATQSAHLTAGSTASKTVSYSGSSPSTGSLTLSVSGLPAGTPAGVRVTGSGGFSQNVTASATITALAPGSYTIVAATVASGGTNQLGTPASQTVTVSAGGATTAAVVYAPAVPSTGSLTISVSGLPAGTAASVRVTGPGGFSQNVTASATINALAPGSYTIVAAIVTSGGTNQLGTPASRTVTVSAGGATTAAVVYAPVVPSTGSLTVTVTGLPGGTSGSVSVTGPGGFSKLITATTTIPALAMGTYTISASAVSEGGTTYTPSPTTQSASVTAGNTATKTVPYTPVVATGAQVTLNQGTRYQTIDGWATTLRMWEEDKANDRFDPAIEQYSAAAVDYLVSTVGINSVRVELMSGWENPADDWTPFHTGSMSYTNWSLGRYQKINDNSNPNVANLAGFQFKMLDYRIERFLLPMKAALAARGEQLHINVNYLDFKWNAAQQGSLSHANNPAEFAEFVLVYFEHLRDKYGLIPDAFEIILEPENTVGWRGDNIGRGMVAVASRLAANGFHPEFIAPSTTSMGGALGYFNKVIAVPGASSLISTFAYHRYGGESHATAAAIYNAANAIGAKTAMLEKVNAGLDVLLEDLTIAHVSGWQQWAMAGTTALSDNGGYYGRVNVGSGTIGPARHTNQLAQVFRNVRRGAVMIGSQSTASTQVTAAFINPDGKWVALVRSRSSGGGPVTINGLPPGSYVVSFTDDNGNDVPPAMVTVSGAFTTQLPAAGILSVRGVS